MADPRIKTLRIKTGVLKRTCKETISYQTDATKIQEKIKKMQEDGISGILRSIATFNIFYIKPDLIAGEDIFYVKKQDQLLQETNNVVLDCQKRLNVAFSDLSALVDNEVELEETEEYIAAKTVIADSKSHITA